MLIATGPRGSGKTTLAINELRQNPNAILVCPDTIQRMHHIRRYPDIADRIYGPDPDRLRGLPLNTVLLLDDLDYFLALHFGRRFDGATATGRSRHITPHTVIPDAT